MGRKYRRREAHLTKYSIILPTLNEGKYVEKTLQSLSKQNLISMPGEVELLVMDSGSTDNTVDICKKYGALVFENVPKGKLTARHLGILAAKGEVILSVDADTYYNPAWLLSVTRHFSRPDVVGVFGPARASNFPEWLISLEMYFSKKMIGLNNAFRKSAYLAIGGFDLSINQRDRQAMIEEEEKRLYARLARFGRIIYDPQAWGESSHRRWSRKDADFDMQVKQGVRF